METAEFRQAAERAAPGGLLGETILAGAGMACFSVKVSALAEVALEWRDLAGAGVPWLEVIIARDLGRELCLTYILRAPAGRRQVALRVSVPLSAGEPARAPSLADFFESAVLWESEIAERFSVLFEGASRRKPTPAPDAPGGFYRRGSVAGGRA
ncbi:MAG: NADH-quinone oxidoreductase subunit C [Bdellovibrionales bacterium]|nr:NADH-quinone oxidoreductase subunit C [Bdellovibrionales bacterium]